MTEVTLVFQNYSNDSNGKNKKDLLKTMEANTKTTDQPQANQSEQSPQRRRASYATEKAPGEGCLQGHQRPRNDPLWSSRRLEASPVIYISPYRRQKQRHHWASRHFQLRVMTHSEQPKTSYPKQKKKT